MRRLILFLLVSLTLGVQGQTRKELRDSLNVLKEQIAFNPDSTELHLRKASINLLLEQWEYAKFEYDLILDAFPDNIAALFYRAYVNARMHRYAFARSDYNRLLALVPGNYEARLGLAVLNQKENRITEALDILNLMTSDFPDSAAVYAARADIEKEQKLYEMAEMDYAEAVKREPANEDYILAHADVLICLERRREAKNLLDRMVKEGTPKAFLKDYYKRCRE